MTIMDAMDPEKVARDIELRAAAKKFLEAYKAECKKHKEGLLLTDPDHMFETGFVIAVTYLTTTPKG